MTEFQPHISGGIEYFERPGSGPVLVLLHGIGSNAASFAPVVQHLTADWRLIAWNAPGYGNSEPLETNWPVAADYAAALRGLLDRLQLKSLLLAGHSLGCLTAAAFAVRHPDRVSALLMASPALGYQVAPGSPLTAATAARIADLTELGPAQFARARAANLVFDPDANPGIVEQIYNGMSRVSLSGYAQATRMLASGTLLQDAALLRVPTELLVGSEDKITPPTSAWQTFDALPETIRGHCRELPLTAHALYQQNPTGFADAVRRIAAAAQTRTLTRTQARKETQ